MRGTLCSVGMRPRFTGWGPDAEALALIDLFHPALSLRDSEERVVRLALYCRAWLLCCRRKG